MSIPSIARLSDHAAVLARERNAKGCIIIIIERDDTYSQGAFFPEATPQDVQDMLCAGICENYIAAREFYPTKPEDVA